MWRCEICRYDMQMYSHVIIFEELLAQALQMNLVGWKQKSGGKPTLVGKTMPETFKDQCKQNHPESSRIIQHPGYHEQCLHWCCAKVVKCYIPHKTPRHTTALLPLCSTPAPALRLPVEESQLQLLVLRHKPAAEHVPRTIREISGKAGPSQQAGTAKLPSNLLSSLQ